MSNLENNGEIRRYGKHIVIMNWIFIILIVPLIYTGLVLLQDFIFHHFHIMGGSKPIPEIADAGLFHQYFAIGLAIFGLVHILMHIRKKEKPIIPKNFSKSWKDVLYSLSYVFFLAKRDERGRSGKYKNIVKMTYLAAIYIIGLAGITGMLSYFGTISTSESIFGILSESTALIHMGTGLIVVLLALFWTGFMIRKMDGVGLRCALLTGTMPIWYVRKNYYNWYKSMGGGYHEPMELDFEIIEDSDKLGVSL